MSGAMDAPSFPREHTTAARRSFFLTFPRLCRNCARALCQGRADLTDPEWPDHGVSLYGVFGRILGIDYCKHVIGPVDL